VQILIFTVSSLGGFFRNLTKDTNSTSNFVYFSLNYLSKPLYISDIKAIFFIENFPSQVKHQERLSLLNPWLFVKTKMNNWAKKVVPTFLRF
jgi:hypothetical protein